MPKLIGNQQVRITVGKAGAATIDATGFTGKSCLEATSQLETLLGPVDGERQNKPEQFVGDAETHIEAQQG